MTNRHGPGGSFSASACAWSGPARSRGPGLKVNGRIGGLLAALPAESTLQPPHQRPRRALRHVVFEAAFVQPLDPRIEVGTGADQPLRRRRQAAKTSGSVSWAWPSRRSGRRPSRPGISPDSIARWVSSQATMCMIRVVTLSDSQAKPTRAKARASSARRGRPRRNRSAPRRRAASPRYKASRSGVT